MNEEKKDVIMSDETFFGTEPVIISEEEARAFLQEEGTNEASYKTELDNQSINGQVLENNNQTIQTDAIELKMEEVNNFEENEKLLEATATIPTSAILEHVSSILEEPYQKEENPVSEIVKPSVMSQGESFREENVTPVQIQEINHSEQPVVEESPVAQTLPVMEQTTISPKQVPQMDAVIQKDLEKIESSPMNIVSQEQQMQPELPVQDLEQTNKPAEMIPQEVEVHKKRKRNPLIIILNILATLFFLFILFEVVIAFLNFNLIKQKKEPSYFATKSVETKGQFDYTIYDMGLFKIVRKEDQKEYSIKLLPFFMDI